jgi:cellulose synthase/poly-beta-1,6-N-acetylglucosamine synthase-like glycosyltransferase
MNARVALELVFGVPALPVVLASGYLVMLTAASRRRAPPPCGTPHLRFDVIVPAHDEEAGIAGTVASLRAVDYPAQLRRVVVVADNCRDETAARARAAGAVVLIREDAACRGKGYALDRAFSWSLGEGFADAMVVVDADTVVSPNLLSAFAARLDAGDQAVQARHGVRNPDAGWRTRLMTIAFALFNDVRLLGRERLGLSAGLRGNGMCFAAPLLRQVPHDAFSVVEDVEYGIRLGLAGHRIRYAAEASALSEMVTTSRAARSQRRRWEAGRFQLARQLAPRLLGQAAARHDPMLLDLAIDLLVPPLAVLTLAAVGGTAISCLALLALGAPRFAVLAGAVSLGGIALYVLRGWALSGTGVRGLASMLRAPGYVAWKIGLALSGNASTPQRWVRTRREHEAGSPGSPP